MSIERLPSSRKASLNFWQNQLEHRIVQSALGKWTSNKPVTRSLAMSQPTVTQSTFLLSFGFGCHRCHTGMLKSALSGNSEYFHSQTIGDSDRLEPRGTLNFV